MRPARLLERILSGSVGNVDFADLINLVESLGFREIGGKGSHRVFARDVAHIRDGTLGPGVNRADGPAFIEFGDDGMGRFRFIAVEGWMDCQHGHRDGRACAEFSWEGQDDCDPASGRGWAALEKDGTLTGHIFIHCADDSAFSAIRAASNAT